MFSNPISFIARCAVDDTHCLLTDHSFVTLIYFRKVAVINPYVFF